MNDGWIYITVFTLPFNFISYLCQDSVKHLPYLFYSDLSKQLVIVVRPPRVFLFQRILVFVSCLEHAPLSTMTMKKCK
jgi:hypothetical protein